MHVVLPVEIVHVAGVDADDHHVDDQRALRGHVEAEREAEESDVVELSCVPAFDESHHEPDDQQDRRDDEVLPPIFPMLFSQFQSSLPSEVEPRCFRTTKLPERITPYLPETEIGDRLP